MGAGFFTIDKISQVSKQNQSLMVKVVFLGNKDHSKLSTIAQLLSTVLSISLSYLQ
jgi:hypothetical protein